MKRRVFVSDSADLALRYPPATLAARDRAVGSGTFRERVRFDLVERAHHAFGLLAAADIAAFAGVSAFVAIEFGVAEGAGLLNLIEVAAAVTAETGICIDVVGFDSGAGLPSPVDYRDHPEIWAEGDFSMPDPGALRAKLPSGAELLLGPVAETIPTFVESLADRQVGFVSVDLDLYRSTKDAMVLFSIPAERLLPVVVTHFDDVIGGPTRIGSVFRTEAAGQLLAIQEFNATQKARHLDLLRVLRYRRPLDRELWLERMYALHVLDHPMRNGIGRRPAMSMSEHGDLDQLGWPL